MVSVIGNSNIKEGDVEVTITKPYEMGNGEAITLALEQLNRDYWWLYGEFWKKGNEDRIKILEIIDDLELALESGIQSDNTSYPWFIQLEEIRRLVSK